MKHINIKMLIAICGYEGAGKSTITQMLCEECNEYQELFVNPKEYVTNELSCDSDMVYNLMRKFVDTNWDWSWCNNKIPILKSTQLQKSKWKSVSFADPLKNVCSILFNYPYLILLGAGHNERKQRETLKTKEYNICGSLTGRQLLEYVGTDVFRNHYDDDIWINLMSNKCKNYLHNGYSVVISDLRFPNEKNMLLSMRGKLILVYRDVKELEPIDRNLHPSKWLYQTFLSDVSHTIVNDGTLNDLRNKISFLLI